MRKIFDKVAEKSKNINDYLKAKAWIIYQAEQEAKKTLKGAKEWGLNTEYRNNLYIKYEDIYYEKQGV